MIKILAVLTLAFSPAPEGSVPLTRAAWESCLQSFAQTESLGSGSEVTIALNALNACSSERGLYTRALTRSANGIIANGQTPAAQAQQRLSVDQRDLTVRLIAFIRRIRR